MDKYLILIQEKQALLKRKKQEIDNIQYDYNNKRHEIGCIDYETYSLKQEIKALEAKIKLVDNAPDFFKENKLDHFILGSAWTAIFLGIITYINLFSGASFVPVNVLLSTVLAATVSVPAYFISIRRKRKELMNISVEQLKQEIDEKNKK